MDDVIGGQDDVDSPTAFRKAGDLFMAFEFEFTLHAQTDRGDLGWIGGILGHLVTSPIVKLAIHSRG
jgi:hypothetical protein